ncbi:MAG: hypothetical protein KAX40_11045 [Herpetosiphon sp.]|nr:hypothetical protein [Herpetosiphon sp.]
MALNNRHQRLTIVYHDQETYFVVRKIGTGKESAPISLGRETPLIIYTP